MNITDHIIKSVTGAPERIVLGNKADVQAKIEPEVVEHDDPYLLNIRQRSAWDNYINPKSKTFGNALQSAVNAGYTWAYANQITTKHWWLGKVRKLNLLGKAEKVLEEILEMPVEVAKWEGHGDDAEEIVKTEPALIKIKQDTAKFLAETQGKDEGYSKRSELTGKGGAPITVPDEKQAQVNDAIMKFLEKKNGD